MNTKLLEIERALKRLAKPGKRELLMRFFKTGAGQYGEGDKFLGVMVPDQRQLAQQYDDLKLSDVKLLLASSWHECRLTALLILVIKYQKADEIQRNRIHQFYLANLQAVNNWDLVDLSAPTLVGEYLLAKPKGLLLKLAKSKQLWHRRIAIVATLAFIKRGDLDWTWRLAVINLTDKHDLMQKATGWMLREAGKRNETALIKFLEQHATKMPRTMLRYALERLSPAKRQYFLKLK